MIYTYPDYYGKFECVGGSCSDNCCAAGWQIVIDEDSLKRYKGMEGDIGERIKNSIDWSDGLYKQQEGRCVLLNAEGLCDIFREAGEDKMCLICQRYPRHYEEYENLREISLSISCPTVAEIVLTRRGAVTYYSKEDDIDEEYEDFDYLMFTKLQEIRQLLFDVLHGRGMSLKLCLTFLILVTHEIQNLIDKDRIFEIDGVLEKWARMLNENGDGNVSNNNNADSGNDGINKNNGNGSDSGNDGIDNNNGNDSNGSNDNGNNGSAAKYVLRRYSHYCKDGMKDRRLIMRDMMTRLYGLEVLDRTWTERIDETTKLLYEDLTNDEYEKLLHDFDEYYGERHEEYVQLAEYYIYTYFCGSVYDYMPESRIKYAVATILLIHEFDMAFWYKNGRLDIADQMELVHRYSKEVEHSDLNIDDMMRRMMKDRAFGLKKMLVAIFSF